MDIIIMTAPPRDPSPLARTLSCNVHYAIDIDREGTLPNVITCFEMGLSLGGPVTILQDDVITCGNFVPYVERLLPTIAAANAIVKWFDVADMPLPGFMECPRFRLKPSQLFGYIQAVTYSRHNAEQIHKFLTALPEPYLRDDRGQCHGDDMYIRQALDCYRKPFWVHSPSIVQHIGIDSLVAPGIPLDMKHKRVSQTFVGIDYDVMQWPAITLSE
jgi:hypothetical protein